MVSLRIIFSVIFLIKKNNFYIQFSHFLMLIGLFLYVVYRDFWPTAYVMKFTSNVNLELGIQATTLVVECLNLSTNQVA